MTWNKSRLMRLGIVFASLMLVACSTGDGGVLQLNNTAQGAILGTAGGAIIGGTSGLGIPLGALIGGVGGAAIGRFIDSHHPLLMATEAKLVQIIWRGDYLKIVLVADYFYLAHSTRLNPATFMELKEIIELLNKYPNTAVSVSGYSDNKGWQKRNVAFSTQRAEVLADYFWQHGLDTRLLAAIGYGGKDPIASNARASGRARNRRIEITMQVAQS